MLKEISLLTGGNEREVCGDYVVHQYCHVDGKVDGLPSGHFLPGSFLVPLSEAGRSIYVRSPKTSTIHIPFGKILLFRADLPHGGITTRLSPNEKSPSQMWPAIHGHLDSRYVTRQAGLLENYQDGQYYFAREHLLLHDLGNHVKVVVDTYRHALDLMDHLDKHRGEELKDPGSWPRETKEWVEEYHQLKRKLKNKRERRQGDANEGPAKNQKKRLKLKSKPSPTPQKGQDDQILHNKQKDTEPRVEEKSTPPTI